VFFTLTNITKNKQFYFLLQLNAVKNFREAAIFTKQQRYDIA